MNWNEIYDGSNPPTEEQILRYLGEGGKLWTRLTEYIEKTYNTRPLASYSNCSMQPGWNIKYRKKSRALCTLYPMEGSFIALVVIGNKEEEQVEAGLEAGVFSPYIKELYEKTRSFGIGRWLMIEARDDEIIGDIMALIDIRAERKV